MVFVLPRILLISAWLFASLGALVERAYAHVPGANEEFAASACTQADTSDPSDHCANACVANTDAALQYVSLAKSPNERRDTGPSPALLPAASIAAFAQPPMHAGRLLLAIGVRLHLRLLATTRLLI